MQDPQAVAARPSDGERLMAALAHLSILVPHAGIIAPLVLWLVHQGTAPYAAYQAKQAFYFHLGIIVLTWSFIISAIVFCVATLGLGLLALLPLLFLVPALHLAPAIYGIIGAVHCYEGRDFRYWLIGEWVQ